MARTLGRLDILLYPGGVIFGSAAAAMAVIMTFRAMGEEDRLGVVMGALRGIIGGVARSLMFFPTIGLLQTGHHRPVLPPLPKGEA